MAVTFWQEKSTEEIQSNHINGIQEAIGKLEDALKITTIASTNVSMTEVYISASDRYRIFQAPSGKRNWLSSPAPVVKKNGSIINSGFTIDYGGGALIFSPRLVSTDVITVDITHTTNDSSQYSTPVVATASVISLPATAMTGQLSVTVQGRTYTNILGTDGDCDNTSLWTTFNASKALDTTNKVFGSNAIRFLKIGDYARGYKSITGKIQSGKYYLVSAYIKNAGAEIAYFAITDNADGYNGMNSKVNIPANTGMTRYGFTLIGDGLEQAISFRAIGLGNALDLYVDGIMINEILADEYTSLTLDQLLQKYSYVSSVKSTLPVRAKSVGKNLINPNEFASKAIQQATATYAKIENIDNRNVLTLTGNASYNAKTLGYKLFKPNTQYTIQMEIKNNGSYGGLIGVNYTDGTSSAVPASGVTTTSWTKYTLTTTAGKTMQDIRLAVVSTGINYIDLNTLCIKEGTDSTYEPHTYTETYTPSDIVLRSLPNGVEDGVSVGIDGNWYKTIRVASRTLQPSDIEGNTVSNANVDLMYTIKFNDVKDFTNSIDSHVEVYGKQQVLWGERDNVNHIGKFCTNASEPKRLYFIVAKGTTVTDARTQLAGLVLTYQLANEVKTQIEGMSKLLSHPNGTIIIEPFIKATSTHNEAILKSMPVKTVESVSKIDGKVRTPIDPSNVNLRRYDKSMSAETGTTTTTIKLTNHGLIVGSVIRNTTRSNAIRKVLTVVDANTVTVNSIASMTTGDNIELYKASITDTTKACTMFIAGATNNEIYETIYEYPSESTTLPSLQYSFPINVAAIIDSNTKAITKVDKQLNDFISYSNAVNLQFDLRLVAGGH